MQACISSSNNHRSVCFCAEPCGQISLTALIHPPQPPSLIFIYGFIVREWHNSVAGSAIIHYDWWYRSCRFPSRLYGRLQRLVFSHRIWSKIAWSCTESHAVPRVCPRAFFHAVLHIWDFLYQISQISRMVIKTSYDGGSSKVASTWSSPSSR